MNGELWNVVSDHTRTYIVGFFGFLSHYGVRDNRGNYDPEGGAPCFLAVFSMCMCNFVRLLLVGHIRGMMLNCIHTE